MADNGYIEIKLDTEGITASAEEVKQILAELGESGAEAGRRLGEGIQEGLTNAFSSIRESLAESMNTGEGSEGMGSSFVSLSTTVREVGEQINTTLQDIRDFMVGFAEGLTDGLNGALSRTQGRMRGVARETQATAQHFRTLGKNAKNTNSHMDNMSKNLKGTIKTLFKYGLGISSLVIVFNKLRQAVGEGFGHLVKKSSEVRAVVADFQATLGQLKNQVGSAFQPIISAVLPILTSLIAKINSAIVAISQFIALLSGQSYFYKATKDVKAYDKALKGAGSSANNMASKLDELNVLSESGGGGGDVVGDFQKVEIPQEVIDKFDALKEKANELKQKLEEAFKPLVENFIEGWDEATKNINLDELAREAKHVGKMVIDIFNDPKVKKSAGSFANRASKALGQIAGATVSIGFSITDNLFGGLERWLEEDGGKIKEHLARMFEINGETVKTWGDFSVTLADIFSVLSGDNAKNVSADIFGLVGESAMGASELVSKLARDISEVTMQPFIDNVEGIKTTLDGLLGNADTVLTGIKDTVGGIFDSLNQMYDERLKPFFDSLSQGFSDTFEQILEAYNTYLKPYVDEMATVISDLFTNHIQPALSKILTYIGALVTKVQVFYENILKPLFDWIATTIIQNVMPVVMTIIKQTVHIIGNIISIIGDLFGVLGGLIDFVSGVFSGDWELAWKGIQEVFENVCDAFKDAWGLVKDFFVDSVDLIWEGVKGALNTIISGFESMVNYVIDGINDIIDALNSALTFDLPDILGGGSVSLGLENVSQISLPRLATGAVIPPNKEFMAVLGDQHNGTNIEAPLDTIKQALIEALDDSSFISYLASISDYTRLTSEKDMSVRIGDRDIARANIRGQKQMGRTLITSV